MGAVFAAPNFWAVERLERSPVRLQCSVLLVPLTKQIRDFWFSRVGVSRGFRRFRSPGSRECRRDFRTPSGLRANDRLNDSRTSSEGFLATAGLASRKKNDNLVQSRGSRDSIFEEKKLAKNIRTQAKSMRVREAYRIR